ncbi:acetolactate synthase AlsS [Levilactobacillus bambusae]|uniref:Acetolactate synthase AlsS n=1 Tax=Levilactobacillus bambusae TaxID=2024736 RepID=A0A2V1N063_9LACO|nr:acetolactate synthase AlsS [Levilactobacillus bambusae]PWF99814.1 acetolactate synthase AlsS [Levilactobacillus bambusae]
MTTNKRGSEALIETMMNHGIHYVFGIPGAKVDQLFEDLQYSTDPNAPQLVITRHEQNAAFMAAGIGRLTGQPGVVAVTSGPGASNLATGLVTATSEGDPVIALGGQVKRDDLARLTHQSIKSQELLAPTTKFSTEVQDANALSETFANAYQTAIAPKAGATFISLPQDVLSETTDRPVMKAPVPVNQGIPTENQLQELASQIKRAKLPVILAGMRASDDETTAGIRRLLQQVHLPVVETFQGAGIISHELEDDYFGRVGLFHNQTGDLLLKKSDLVIAVGYDPVEYEARNWNQDRTGQIINLDSIDPELTVDYQPDMMMTGNMGATLTALAAQFDSSFSLNQSATDYLTTLREKRDAEDVPPVITDSTRVHPLALVSELQNCITDEMTVTVDVGSHYIWMARHFRSYEPRHLLFSNGMQTLGVALPWAISAALVRPNTQIVSISGDGGFLFSGQELETAVRLNLNIVHIIWNDGHYDMVKFQEETKYGRSAGVDFGGVDFVQYAESFGATGLRVTNEDDLAAVLAEAFQTEGPVIVDVPVDYSENSQLSQTLLDDQFY